MKSDNKLDEMMFFFLFRWRWNDVIVDI